MSRPLRVLLIEDSEDDATLLLRELRRGGYDPLFERVDTPSAMRDALERQSWDVVLSDYSLPQFNAPAALALLQQRNLDLPFIIISGTIGEESAVAALKAGAHDFIVKGQPARLLPAIERELREASERGARRQAELALHESEQRFRRLAERAPDLIYRYRLAPTPGFDYVSPAATAITGYTPEDYYADPDLAGKLAHPDERPLLDALAQASAVPNTPLTLRWVRKDGRVIWTDHRIAPLQDAAGTLVAVEGIARDVTAQMQAETQISRQLARLAALRAIDMAITASLDLRVTLSVFLDQVTSQLQVDAAAVLLLNGYTQTLEYAAGRGFRTAALRRTRLRLGEGHAGRAARERHMISIPNLAEDTGDFVRAPLLEGEGFIAYYGVPLIAKGQAKGVLEVFHRAAIEADADWQDFLEALAGQAAIAIDNAALFDDLQRSNVELALAYDTTLEGWSRALDLRDKETEGHSQRVTEMTVQLARAIGLSEAELVHIRRGALLHDIGKMGIPDAILLKPGPLTDDEWAIMRKHPVYAYELLAPIGFLKEALDIPYGHHEKWDGSGYPRKLKGAQLPLAARIFAVADVWDAMRSDRPYRKGWPEEQVREHIRSLSGTHFDPRVVQVFLELEREPDQAWFPDPYSPPPPAPDRGPDAF